MARLLPLSAIDPDAYDGVPGDRRTPMQQHIWAEAYAETMARGGRVMVCLVGRPEAPCALAPLAVPVDGARRRTLLGAEDLWESVEVAAADTAALKVLARELARTGKPLRFGHYPVDGDFIRFLRIAHGWRGIVVMKPFPNGAMPRIALDEGWTNPESKLTSRRRSDLRRMMRNAEKSGDVRFEIHETFGDDLDRLLDEAFAVERNNWKGREGTAMATDGQKGAFYRAYAHKAAARGILRLCFMRIDGAAAAMQFAVECDDAFWLLKIGYDDRFRRCSPGNLLMRETIAHAAGRGLSGYEFLGKEASWTKLWASDARPIAALRTYPYTPSGLTALAGDGLALAIGKIRTRFAARRAGTAGNEPGAQGEAAAHA